MTDYPRLLELMKSRRSIRRFTERAVSREDLERLFDAARWAPSNHNRQAWKFIVLTQREQIRALAENVGRRFAAKRQSLPAVASAYANELAHYTTIFSAAPVLVVALHKRPASVASPLLEGLRHPELVSGEPLSAAMAVQNLLLAAHALGLGTCVLTGPLLVPEAIPAVLSLPPGFDLTCFVAVGYPAESPEAPRRKSLELIVEYIEDQASQPPEPYVSSAIGIDGEHTPPACGFRRRAETVVPSRKVSGAPPDITRGPLALPALNRSPEP